jgi:hypothetical protein
MTASHRNALEAVAELNTNDPLAHVWTAGRFTGTITCSVCGLLPLDDDDLSSECEQATR